MWAHIATVLGRVAFAAMALVAFKYLIWWKVLLWALVSYLVSSQISAKPIEQTFKFLRLRERELKDKKD